MLDIVVDPDAFRSDLGAMRDQVPFALKNTINDLGLSVQRRERAHMHEIFDERRPDWVDRSVKITHFATKREEWLTIGIHPPGADGDARQDILTKFEEDHEKLPFKGKFVAVPTGAKRSKRDVVLTTQRPAAFDFHRVGNRIIGYKRTFIVNVRPDLALILQRVGKGARSTVRSLYLLLRSVPIEPDLKFEPIADLVVAKEVEATFDRRFAEAMQTAR